MAERARTPLSTYRLQLRPRGEGHPGLDFAGTADLVEYLADLGVTHLYLSPVLQAAPGSTHGYDVVDPTTVWAELGGEAGLRALAERAHDAGLGLVVDLVPNHLGTGPANPLWERLLAEGQGSQAARFFDVDWDSPLPGASGKLILPVLGDQYGAVLERGELEVVAAGDAWRLRYFEQSFPLSAESLAAIARSGGVTALSGTPREPATWQRLHALLEQQHYRLVWWRSGDALINYRRFFAIRDLAGVRVEDDVVFDHTHDLVLRLVADGVIDGLRIDHPDGLRDPTRYLQRLCERSGGAWTVVEKITHPGETLPDWPVAGTTGYDFCNDVLGLFVDGATASSFDDRDFAPFAEAGKREVLERDLAADSGRLARRLWALSQDELAARDVTLRDCRSALTAAVCAVPVYRTYVDPEGGEADERDAAVLATAFAAARRRSPDVPEPLWALLHRLLLAATDDGPAHRDFVARFQQLSSAAMAKGVEDTAFYCNRRLLALNEVGGDPGRLGIDVATFHAANAERARHHPAGMLTTATHDTKRGEDVRLRIAALSELGAQWPRLRDRWMGVSGGDPDAAALLLQTLVGVWPLDGSADDVPRERVKAYLVKALREAGERTDWRDPDEAFEARAAAAVDTALDDREVGAEIEALAARAGAIAMVSGLAQVLLRVASPGVPDTYQGNELWDDSLVDPDNRRPVDFAVRRRLLAGLAGADPAGLWCARRDGRVKLWVLARALGARRRSPGYFGAEAGYNRLPTRGRWAEHIVAFARTDRRGAPGAVAVSLARPGALIARSEGDSWGSALADTAVALPPGRWADALSERSRDVGEDVALSDVLADLPVALLVRA